MCGRIVTRASKRNMKEAFGVEIGEDLLPRYNLAPSQDVPVVVAEGKRRALATMRWGFPTEKALLINARAETVALRPAFADSFARRRCLVPVQAFYEWKRAGKSRQPFLIERADEQMFAIAAIWEPQADADRCCLLTTESNALVRQLHDRMPVIVSPEDYGRWLDPFADAASLKSMLRPASDDELKMFPVNAAVNNSNYDGADCVEPATGELQPSLF